MRRTELWLGASVFTLSLGLLLVRFLVPRPVGVTDNGDGWRLLCQVGANEAGRAATDQLVQFTYDHASDCGKPPYVSAQVWIAKVAQWLDPGTGLNVVVIGVLSCVLAAAGVTVVVLGLPLRTRHRLVAGALVLLLVADSAFFGYFASVLSEGPAFLGIVLMVGGLLLLSRDGGWRYAGAAVTIAGALIGINAKGQTVMILPLLAIALLLLRPPGRLRWLLPVSLITVLTAAPPTSPSHFTALQSASSSAMDENFERINVYNAIFNSVVDGQHDTSGDLAALGLPHSYEHHVGTRYWSADAAPQREPDFDRYADRFTRANLIDYYASHPGRTTEILDRAATDLLTARPDYQGNFGTEFGKKYRVPVLSGLTSLAAPLGMYVLLPLWLATALAGARALRRGRRGLGVVLLFVLAIALGQFGIAGLAEGIENVKHQVVALFCTLFGVLLAVTSLLPYETRPDPRSPAARARRVRLRDRRRPDSGHDRTDHHEPGRRRTTSAAAGR